MEITISINEIMIFLLMLAGIGALVYLLLLFKKATEVLTIAKDLINNRKKEIDRTIAQLPEIMDNVNTITAKSTILVDNIDEMVVNSKDNIEGIIASANSSLSDINRITETANSVVYRVGNTAETAVDSVDSFANNIADISRMFGSNKDNLIDYIYIIKDFIEELRRILRR